MGRSEEFGRGADRSAPAATLARLLDRPLADAPGAEALVHVAASGERRAWTFVELADEVARRAATLAADGIGVGDRVGVVATRDAALVPSILALLRLGATYVPLDPAAPDHRWSLIADDVALAAVVGPGELLGRRAAVAHLPRLDWDAPLAGCAPPPPPDDPELPAYVLFTSGSTGTPKAVVVSHANVLSRVASYIALSDGPVRYLLHSSLCFDGAVGGMFSTLARGGCLVLPPDEVAGDPERAAHLVAAERVTHLEPVPSWYAALLDLASPGELASVTVVILGGEVLAPGLAAEHHRALPGARLFNDYGPTEATVAATVFEVPADWGGDRIPIGRPHANTTIHVLDESMDPRPPGEVGQLWIGGAGVAAYLNRPDDPSFRPNPFGPGRLYASGDLATWREDGLLDLRGRLDRQVKVRGQRVEPGEVEAGLADLPGVGACAVEVDRSTGADRLVAYVAPSPGATLEHDDVVARLAERLPSHLRPDVVLVLAALPLTPGGKVDRRALPAPVSNGAVGAPPAPGAERAVADAFQEVLGLAEVGAGTDFFAVGGHSLAAARVVARLRRTFGVRVVVQDLVQSPTVSRLAAELQSRAPEAGADHLPVRRERPADEVWRAAATPRQESFWFLEFLRGGEGGSNLVELITFPPATPEDVLRAAVAAVGARNGSLRTALVMEEDGLFQLVSPAADVVHEVHHLGDAADDDAVDRLAEAFGARPFAFDVAPLARWGLIHGPDGPVLVLVVHHAVSDGWSLTVLVEQLVAVVAAGGRADALPPVELEYLDVAEHLQERMAGPDAVAAEEHWVRRLREDGTAAAGLLPYDHPPSLTADLTAGVVHGRIEAPVLAALTALCRQSGATLYHGLVASFGASLHRSSGIDRFFLGGPLSGRGEPELDQVVGCCINTGFFRVDATGDPGFGTLLRRVAADAAADEPHQWLPTEVPLRVAETAVQDGGVTVLVNLLNGPTPALDAGLGPATERSLASVMAYTDLDLYLTPDGDTLKVEVVHALGRIERETADRLLRRWLHLLGQAVRAPDRSLSDLPDVDPDEEAERRRLEGDPGPAPDATLLPRIEAQLTGRTDAVAVVDGGGPRPWSWLDDRSRTVAAALAASGVARGDHVVLAIDGTADVIALLLACWRLGAVAVPVGARQSPDRLAAVVAASGAVATVDGDTFDAILQAGAGAPTGAFEPVALRPEDPAYVLFTSGSTGVPKGVLVGHGALLASTLARVDAYPERPAVALVAHDLAFDAALGIVTWYLATGGTLVLADHDDRLDPDRLAVLVEEHAVGQLDIVPSHYRLLLETAEPAGLRTLELVTLGGEECHPSLVAAHHAVVPWARLVNEYGPTESTVWALAHDCTPADADLDRVPIGTPIRGVVARVADAQGRPLPLGSSGELLLGGHLLAVGYLGDPDTTAARFFERDGRRWYRTGDLVRHAAGGEITFLGRIDEQLKVRGFRIEPGEVESVITELDDVVRTVVGAVTAPDGSALLTAWVQPSRAARLTSAVVREWCRQRLPEWLVPSMVVLVDDLPETVAGKVDRSRLPAPELSGSGAGALEPPATEVEAAIAAIWADLLGHPVGVDQDFFVIGGHSLLAARMVTRLRRELGAELHLRDMINTPRVRDIADAIEASGGIVHAGAEPLAPRHIDDLDRAGARALLDRIGELDEAELACLLTQTSGGSVGAERELRERLAGVLHTRIASPAHLSPNQARLWYLQQLETASAAYHETVVLRLEGPLDADALEGALQAVVARHEWLRSHVAVDDSGPRQVVAPTRAVTLPRRELAGDGVGVADWIDELESAPIDLGTGPLWRAELARLGPDEHVFVMVVHHVACDASSIGVLLHELGLHYDATVAGAAADLPEPVSAGDLGDRLHHLAQADGMADLVAARSEELAGTDLSARVPADVDHPAGGPAGRVTSDLDPALAEAVLACAEATGVTPFAVIAAAVAAVVGRFTGRDDVALGVPIDLRWQIDEADDVFAFLVETAAVPVRRTVSASLAETAAAIRDAVGDALADPVPFEAVVARLRTMGELPRTGTPLHVYAGWLEGDDEPRLGATGPKVRHLERPLGPAKFDLHWTAIGSGGRIRLHLEHDTDRISPPAAQRLVDHALHVLTEATRHPTTPLAELSLVPPAELQRLSAFEGAAAPAPSVDLLTFLDIAGHGPEVLLDTVGDDAAATAVDAATLARRVDDLAAALVAAGVAPGDPVALSAHRSAAMVVGLLAVLRAGGAFVPVDPALPPARQRLIVEQVGARTLLGAADWGEALADGTDRTVVAVDDDGVPAEPAPSGADRPTLPARRPGDVAYVMFTSGSTGIPKGVVVTDANVVARVESYAGVLGTEPVRYLLHSALGFDASVYLFWVLRNGGRLVLPPDRWAGDPLALAKAIERHAVTDSFFVPSLYGLVLQAAPGGLPSLRQVCVGGEVMPLTLPAAHRAVAPEARLLNVYGPTETVVTATAHVVEGEPSTPVPIGRPHPGTQARVVDAAGRMAPVGAPGRLHIGGPSVAAGYHGRPDETARAFRDEVVADDDGTVRWYDTGDVVRWDDHGELHFLGRDDRQVKLRGQRIELPDIEAALRDLPGVDDAVVEMLGTGAAARLVGIVAPQPTDATEAELKTRLGEVLPRGWVPDRVLGADAVPRMPGGKVDRALVSELVLAANAADPTATGPVEKASATERGIAATMAALLERDTVGLDDDFFDLGGHSLLAARLVGALQAQLGAEIPLAELVNGATPRRLAAVAYRSLAETWAAPSDTATVSLLRPGGDLAPLVIVARDGETGLYLRHFLREIDPERPLWVLLRPATTFGTGTVPDLAAEGALAATVLAETFPTGPIHVIGHSASGLVAIEAARNLGPQAGLVALIDTVPPPSLLERVTYVVGVVVRFPLAPRLKVRNWWRRRTERHLVVEDTGAVDPVLISKIRDDLDEAGAQALRMKPYRGRAVLLTAEESRVALGSDHLGWKRWCPELQLETMPGDHLGILMPPLVDHTVEVLDKLFATEP